MAFVTSTPAPFIPTARSTNPLTKLRPSPRIVAPNRRRPCPSMAQTPPPSPEYELDTEAIKTKTMQVVTDVSARPFYYGKIAGYAVGAVVVLTVLRAVVSAVDSLPFLPGALELIGLGYSAWFVWRYVLFKESREELLEELEDLLGRAKPSS